MPNLPRWVMSPPTALLVDRSLRDGPGAVRTPTRGSGILRTVSRPGHAAGRGSSSAALTNNLNSGNPVNLIYVKLAALFFL